jgi:cell division protein FtsB
VKECIKTVRVLSEMMSQLAEELESSEAENNAFIKQIAELKAEIERLKRCQK